MSESLQPREIRTRKVGWPSRSCRGEGNRLRTAVTGDPQDTPGVREGARSEGLVWNRRDPPRLPTSGEGGGYKPTAKCHRAGRESEGLVVPWMASTRTTLEGRGPALVVLADRGKGKGMPLGASYPFEEAREPGKELSVVAEFAVTSGADVDSQGPTRLTTSWWTVVALAHVSNACGTGRPSVSRVREIRTHGLKGGFRNPGSQEHRA
jgi:hypothetical protein